MESATARQRRSPMMSTYEVIVIGAGPAGLSAALALKDAGVEALVVDQADTVGASWRGRYDRLRLNTPRAMSHLPGRRYPKGTPTFPSRDEVVAHLDEHSAGLNVRLGERVTRIERDGQQWVVHGPSEPLSAPHVIVATGFENVAVLPDWPGRDDVRRRARALARLPQRRAVRRPQRARRRRRLLGHGDRLRPRGRRRGQGMAVGPQRAGDLPAHRSGRAARRLHRAGAVQAPDRPRRPDRDRRAQAVGRRPERLRPAAARRGHRRPLPPHVSGAGDRRPRGRSTRSRTAGSRSCAASTRSARARRAWPTARPSRPTRSSARPATGAGSRRWSATSACSTRTGCRPSSAPTRPRRGCGSWATSPGRG